MLGPLPARQVCHGAGGVPGGPVLLPLGWLPAVDRAQARRVVLGVAGFLWGSMPVPFAGVRCRGVARPGCPTPPYSWGWVWLRSRQVMPGVPWFPVAVWCCVGCARLDAHSCRGLCGVPALGGAGLPVVGVASLACCWCCAATGVEPDRLGDEEDVAADVRAGILVALVAVVARDQGWRVVMVAAVLWGE